MWLDLGKRSKIYLDGLRHWLETPELRSPWWLVCVRPFALRSHSIASRYADDFTLLVSPRGSILNAKGYLLHLHATPRCHRKTPLLNALCVRTGLGAFRTHAVSSDVKWKQSGNISWFCGSIRLTPGTFTRLISTHTRRILDYITTHRWLILVFILSLSSNISFDSASSSFLFIFFV